jgi:hypothetical protein
MTWSKRAPGWCFPAQAKPPSSDDEQRTTNVNCQNKKRKRKVGTGGNPGEPSVAALDIGGAAGAPTETASLPLLR